MTKTIPEINQELTEIAENIVQDQVDNQYEEYVDEMSFLCDQKYLASVSYDLDAEFYGIV
jgi:hypothetical protein